VLPAVGEGSSAFRARARPLKLLPRFTRCIFYPQRLLFAYLSLAVLTFCCLRAHFYDPFKPTERERHPTAPSREHEASAVELSRVASSGRESMALAVPLAARVPPQ